MDDNVNMREAIRIFDGNISLKATKYSVKCLTEVMEKSFIHEAKWQTIVSEIATHK